MGLCNDQSVTFLRGLGYNVIRHPNAAVKPLDLIGVQNGGPNYLGPLNLLITKPSGDLPAIQADIVAADVNGQKSSKLSVGIGINIIGAVISAMGGNLGVNLNFTDATRVEFQYVGVLNDQAVPLEIGNYLRDGQVDAGNLVLKQYVLGNGKLYLVTKTAKSKKFTVSFEKSNGAGAAVDVPVIQAAAGGKIDVTVQGQAKNVITFEGEVPLVFGFQSYEMGVKDGNLALMSSQAGSMYLSVAGTTLLNDNGMLELGF